MKSIICLLLLTLYIALPSNCQALISVEHVTKERAEALGVSFKIHKNGEAGYAVTMDFELKGELQNISYVLLQIGEGEHRVMSAPIRVTQQDEAKKSARFSAFPRYLSNSFLMIVVYNGPKGDVGYRLKVDDFVDLPQVNE